MLEKNKVDWWAISTPTHASFLRQFSSIPPLQKTLQCSQVASMRAQWRGSYLHLLTWTSLVLPYFKYWLPLRCQTSLSLNYTHLIGRCKGMATPPTDIWQWAALWILFTSIMLISTSTITQYISGFPQIWSQALRLSVLSWDSLLLQNRIKKNEQTCHTSHTACTHLCRALHFKLLKFPKILLFLPIPAYLKLGGTCGKFLKIQSNLEKRAFHYLSFFFLCTFFLLQAPISRLSTFLLPQHATRQTGDHELHSSLLTLSSNIRVTHVTRRKRPFAMS